MHAAGGPMQLFTIRPWPHQLQIQLHGIGIFDEHGIGVNLCNVQEAIGACESVWSPLPSPCSPARRAEICAA